MTIPLSTLSLTETQTNDGDDVIFGVIVVAVDVFNIKILILIILEVISIS